MKRVVCQQGSRQMSTPTPGVGIVIQPLNSVEQGPVKWLSSFITLITRGLPLKDQQTVIRARIHYKEYFLTPAPTINSCFVIPRLF